jgi:serine protease
VVDDPLFARQWGLRQLNVPSAWKQGALGRGAVIAVIDTGVDLHHPDLRRNLTKGIDLGPEGASNDCPGPQDEIGHGTEVAGVAVATGDNGIGIVGVAPEATVMPIQVMDLQEMTGPLQGYEKVAEINRRVAEGIRYAVDHRADVINLSLSTSYVTDPPGSGLSDAIEYAWGKGVVVVAAAGNAGDPICKYPGSHPLVLCVASTDRDGNVSAYSNQPSKPSGDTAVLGPGGNETGGVKCESDNLTWTTMLPADWDCGVGGYTTSGGTSLASPAVAGVAALLSGRGLNNKQIVDCLLKTASNGGTYDRATGYGIVDAGKAVKRCSRR